ncbi:MAG: hypothetical protein L6U99_02910 [Clostridium sp.]|nr:MAG: hypothetical protein L6U99_02910 [Clostridium sp.]
MKDGAKKEETKNKIKFIDSDVIRPEFKDAWDNNKPLPDLHGYVTMAEFALIQEYGE